MKKVAELKGAELDYWVARASEAWKWAHKWFPTMTLDPTFKSFEIRGEAEQFCYLVPNNPMRQDPQVFRPSTDWEQGGPLIEQFMISISWHGPCVPRSWGARTANTGRTEIVHAEGPTALIAAMRALVVSKLGEGISEAANP
jgi:hypothetical protein